MSVPRSPVTNPISVPQFEACEPCEDCESKTLPTFFCIDCDTNFCDDCWARQISHRKGKGNQNAHEKINKKVVEHLKEIFTPASDPVVQRELHQKDQEATWFGVCRGVSGQPELQDHGRYSDLIRDSWTGEFRECWPQLVSFVGQTGIESVNICSSADMEQVRAKALL